ncbi:hypothetical protein OE749_16520 [Aestuariibacter sp. AA17]|uniref:Uncharacterized protein n=1 Tax=Fluctibacter corallii TaxID=2984329 RepID=A0ABT3ACB2_9ALTE|nr:hypothetical protein [Aestuariibacter sp. AA17]MCV2886300.1 hypothetical protein [Aestuariibacter sp. AA17]
MIRSLSNNARGVWDVMRRIHNANKHPNRSIQVSQLSNTGMSSDNWNAGLKELLDQQLVEHIDNGYKVNDSDLEKLKQLNID